MKYRSCNRLHTCMYGVFNMKERDLLVTSTILANLLIQAKIPIIRIAKNREDETKQVYFFENTEPARKIAEGYKQANKRTHNEMENMK